MKKNRSFGMNIGTSSILIIVVILTLVCFAGLSLASANADYQLCKKLADRTTAYYDAASEGYEAIKDACEANENSEFRNSYNISDTQVLKINAQLNPGDGTNYRLDSFNVLTVDTPKLDNSLSLLLGD